MKVCHNELDPKGLDKNFWGPIFKADSVIKPCWRTEDKTNIYTLFAQFLGR